MRRRALLAAAAITLSALSLPSTAGASLAFGTAPKLPTLPTVTINAKSQTINATMATFSVATTETSGWNVTVQGQSGTGKSAVFAQYCASAKCGTTAEGYVTSGFTLPADSLKLNTTGAKFSGHLTNAPNQKRDLNMVMLAVVGAHLSGQPLNHQLTDIKASLVRTCKTAPAYRLVALPGTVPPKPGLIRTAEGGGAVEVEVWEMTAEAFGNFVAAIPPPLGIGTLQLEDGEQVKGFLCESYAVAGARDITHFGGWRNFLKSPAQ